jgi:hypothetical protein
MNIPAPAAPAGFVPLISGSQTGPLGIVHLPRFWSKMRAHAYGALAEGYRHGVGGSDEALLTAFGIDGDAFASYIAADAPDYQTLETWVRAHATDLSAETIRTFNDQITGFEMPDPRRTEWSARFGLTDGTFALAVGLNQLDDWDLVHAQLSAPGAPSTSYVPAIGSGVAGPLGALHLPRLWLKHRLHGVGRLPTGYRHGVGGFDEMVTDGLGIDRDAFATYVETEKPDYVNAEVWVRRQAKTLSAGTVAALNARILSTKFPAERLAERRAELGPIANALELGIPLNDLDDWAGLHRQLSAVAG